MFTQAFHGVLIVRLFAVKLVEGEKHRLLQLGGGAENILCAHLHAILAVDHDHAGVGHAERRVGIAHEIVRAGAVKHVQLLAEKLGVEYSGENRVAIFFLYGEIIGDSVSVLYGASTFYHSTLVEHGLGECGFPGSLASEQGDVFDFVAFVLLHTAEFFLGILF